MLPQRSLLGGAAPMLMLRETAHRPLPILQAECNIAAFASELGEADVAAEFQRHAAARLAAVDALLWDAGSGQWRDLWLGPAGEGEGASAASGAAVTAGAARQPPAQAAAQAAAGGDAPASWSSYRQSPVVSASNWVPLYCGCAPAGSRQAAAAVASLRRSGLLQAAGVAVTLTETGQQWDWPNAWPPITCMLLEGCAAAGGADGEQARRGAGFPGWAVCRRRPPCCPAPCAPAGSCAASVRLALGLRCCANRPPRLARLPAAPQLAAQMAQQYLATAHAAWRQSGRMHEKFDALQAGAPGGGGEYACEDGFGWTNGVALRLLQRYGWWPEAAAA